MKIELEFQLIIIGKKKGKEKIEELFKKLLIRAYIDISFIILAIFRLNAEKWRLSRLEQTKLFSYNLSR